MPTAANFNFIPAHQLTVIGDDSGAFTATLSKEGFLQFSREMVGIYDLDKKFFSFYADPIKKAIGFKLLDSLNLNPIKKVRKLSMSKQGRGSACIIKLLKSIGVEVQTTAKRVKIHKHVSILDGDIYYIKLSDVDYKKI